MPADGFHPVALTDGGCCLACSSLRTHGQLQELIRNPNLRNFHLLLIGVGLSPAYTMLMKALCTSKVCTYIPCGSDYKMVREAVAEVSFVLNSSSMSSSA
jgi:hypothetical protein